MTAVHRMPSEIRKVCRYVAARIENLGRPQSHETSPNGAAQILKTMRRRAESAKSLEERTIAQETLVALGPDILDELAKGLTPPLQALYQTSGVDLVTPSLLQLLDDAGAPPVSPAQERLRAIRKQQLAAMTFNEVEALAQRLDPGLQRHYRRSGAAAVEGWLLRLLP